MLTRVWRRTLRAFDRPGLRALLVVPGSVWVSLTYHTPCLVYRRGGAWIHHYRGAKIPHAELGRAAPPGVFTAEARDIFPYAYTPLPGDVIFDIGAGVGAETLVFSRLVGSTGRVVSVEAHPRTYARLVDLCTVNRLANVTPLQAAVLDTDGVVRISDRANRSRNTVLDADGDGIDVEPRRVDTIAAELGIRRIDLLTMNIEVRSVRRSRAWACCSRARGTSASAAMTFLPTTAVRKSCGPGRSSPIISASAASGSQRGTTAPNPWTRDYVYGINTGAP